MGNNKSKKAYDSLDEFYLGFEELICTLFEQEKTPDTFTRRKSYPKRRSQQVLEMDKAKFVSNLALYIDSDNKKEISIDKIKSQFDKILVSTLNPLAETDKLVLLFISTLNKISSNFLNASFYFNVFNDGFKFYKVNYKNIINADDPITMRTCHLPKQKEEKISNVEDVETRNFSDFLTKLIEVFKIIFDNKTKEIKLLFAFSDDILFQFALYFMLVENVHDFLKFGNEVTVSFFILKLEDHFNEDNDKIQLAILSNILNFLILKALSDVIPFKRVNYVFVELENKNFRRELPIPDEFKGNYRKIISYLTNKIPLYEDFNNNIVANLVKIYQHSKCENVLTSLNFLFIIEKIPLGIYLNYVLNLTSVVDTFKKTEKKLILLYEEKEECVKEYMESFQMNKNFLVIFIRNKIFDEINLIVNKGIYVSSLATMTRHTEKVNLVCNIRDTTLDEGIVKLFAESLLEFVDELIPIASKLHIEVDKEFNFYLKFSDKQLDLLNNEKYDPKKIKIEVVLDQVRHKFPEEMIKNEFILDSDLIYLVNTDKRKSHHSQISNNLTHYLEGNNFFTEFKFVKEKISAFVENSATLPTSVGYKSLEKLFSKFGPSDQGVYFTFSIMMKIPMTIFATMKPTGSIPELKEILSEILQFCRGCGLCMVLINCNLFQTSSSEILIKQLIKKFPSLNNNQIFFSIYTGGNKLFMINAYIKRKNKLIIAIHIKSQLTGGKFHEYKKPLTPGENSHFKLIDEFFHSLDKLDRNVKKYSQLYSSIEYSLYLNDKDTNPKHLFKLLILDNVEYFLSLSQSKKILNSDKLLLMHTIIKKIFNKNNFKCTKFSLEPDKFLLNKDKEYIEIIEIFTKHTSLTNFLYINNHNFPLLNPLLKDEYVKGNFSLGKLRLTDHVLSDLLFSLVDNEIRMEEVDLIYEKSLNYLCPLEKISKFVSFYQKYKSNEWEVVSPNSKVTAMNNMFLNIFKKLDSFPKVSQIVIYFNNLQHVENIKDVGWMETLMNFLKIFFNNIILKGKALSRKEISSCPEYEQIFRFESHRFVEDEDKLLFLFKKNVEFNKTLYNKKNILKIVFSFILNKRFIRVEKQSSRGSSTFNI